MTLPAGKASSVAAIRSCNHRCKAGLYDEISPAFAVLLPVRTVGVMGDGRTYDQACALRTVTSTDGMTVDYHPFDYPTPLSTRCRDQPGDLRHHVEASWHDRMGIIPLRERCFELTENIAYARPAVTHIGVLKG